MLTNFNAYDPRNANVLQMRVMLHDIRKRLIDSCTDVLSNSNTSTIKVQPINQQVTNQLTII